MNYRKWKKNYKKVHGYNPPLKDDKRKQAKLARKCAREFVQFQTFSVDIISNFVKNVTYAMAEITEGISIAFHNIAESLRREN